MEWTRERIMRQLRGGLIVSCQALEHEPLYRPEGGIMPLMAKAAAQSGAAGIRANTVRDIKQIRQAVDLPIIGIIKKQYPGSDVYITATMDEVDALAAAGTPVIALDGTRRRRPDGSLPEEFIRKVKEAYPDQLLMADIATVEEARICEQAGADFVGTTLCGYTPDTLEHTQLNLDLVASLAGAVSCKVIAEGHVHTPEQAKACLEAGAFAVVVGGAITRPAEITARFVKEMEGAG